MQNLDDSTSVTICRTEVNVKKLHYRWMIDNFRSLHDERGNSLSSSAFSADNDEFKWYLLLIPKYSSDPRWVSLHLYIHNAKQMDKYCPIYGNAEFSIMNVKNETLTKNIAFTFSNSCVIHHSVNNFVERRHLFDEANQLLPNDQLTITCKMSYTKQTDIINVCSKSFVNSREKSKPVCLGGIETLFMDEKFSDITLCVNKQKFPVHKSILAARSPYFRKMFEADWMEKNLNSIELKETDETVFMEVLRYVYTGCPQKLDIMVSQLLEAADKFDLGELKLICEEELLKDLSTETAIDLLILADRFNAMNLKMKTINYIKMNSYNPNMLTEEVRNDLVLMQPHLLLEVINALAEKSLQKVLNE